MTARELSFSFADADRWIGARTQVERICPECSSQRKAHHRKAPCFGLRRTAADRIVFACQNCGLEGVVTEGFGQDHPATRPPRRQPERQEGPNPRDHATDMVAEALWSRAVPAAGIEIAETYWRVRNLTPPIPPTIRFLSDHQGYPTLICAAGQVELDGEDWRAPAFVTGVQRIYLKPDGSGKAQKPRSLGTIKGQPIVVFVNPESLALVIGEGIEKVHAQASAMGVDGWATAGKSFFRHLGAEIPEAVESVTLIQDPDAQKEVEELARLISDRGMEVRIV